MRVRREAIGTTTGHAEQGPTAVEAYTLDTEDGLAVTVWTYGATLVEVLVPDRAGRVANVVVRAPDLATQQDRARSCYLGATVGRYARCIAGARFALDGVEHRVDANEGRHHVHGGTLGFDRFVWEADVEEERERLSLRLRLDRPDGDQGYPGALSAETVYRVERGGRLTFEHRATTTAATVVALTNHAAWNLAGAGTVDGHRLAINAGRVLLVDRDVVPVGPPAAVAGTPFDYSTARPIAGERLDHSFVLDDQAWAAELVDPVSGRAMLVRTDQPGLQVYSGEVLPEPRAGLCLQTGAWPDSPNRPDYPSSRLDPGEVYLHRTTHEFSARARAPRTAA